MLHVALCEFCRWLDPLFGTREVHADVQASLTPIGEADIPVVLPYDGSGDRKAQSAAVLNATGSQRVGPWQAAARLNESDLQQVADLVISSHRA